MDSLDHNINSIDDGPLYRRLDWGAFWTATLVAFAVYFGTLAPTVTLEDCGEQATAAAHLGVPHPPGYPTWTIITWYFTKLFSFVTIYGQPNPAWAVALASAFFGALAAGFTAILICRSGIDILRSIPSVAQTLSPKTINAFAWVSGVASSLIFAFSPVMWSQSVIVEAYSMHAFFFVLILFLGYTWMRAPDTQLPGLNWPMIFLFGILFMTIVGLAFSLIFRMDSENMAQVGKYYLIYTLLGFGAVALMGWIWMKHPKDRILLLLTYSFGLGLGNYQVLALLIITLIVVILVKDMDLLRDFAIAGAPYLIVYVMIKLGSLPPISHPTSTEFYVYMIMNFAAMTAYYFFLPRGKTVAPAMFFAQMGVLIYVFMPLSSETNPPMNWGYPRTWEGFLHAIFRGQYEQITPVPIFSLAFIEQVEFFLADLRGCFTLPLVIPGLLIFSAWSITYKGVRAKALNATIFLAPFAVALIMMEEILVPVGTEIPLLSAAYHTVIVLILALTFVGILTLILEELKALGTMLVSPTAKMSHRIMSALILVVVLAVVLWYLFNLGIKIRDITDPLFKADAALSPEIKNLIFIQTLGLLSIMILPFLLAVLFLRLMESRIALAMDFDQSSRKWILATVSGFLVMSILLVVLANLKGDIQDMFIQRVKFISSHALFGFWIGYGLLFGLAYGTMMMRNSAVIRMMGILIVIILFPIIPIYVNGYNPELLRIYGGAEQNGHDFGWQFGNYQLRGADAILEELSPDEEPIPDPSYPKEMGPDAVFYGGTDPGRFVPTYMIFGANVRSDVFLITQNALADNTYMSVMRDLYGDKIFIPSQQDSAGAFQRYIQEVENGTRPRNADLKVEGGRVQVSGALGVMEINGILAQIIFERNIWKHSFYVEESYVIPWMFPYLLPHGLIMEITPKKMQSLEQKVVNQDIDFWDWYCRRFIGDIKFLRDVTARKSFSKLRSALGGLYASSPRRMFAEAEIAFKQARMLYPLSPEANFRLVNEVLLPNQRFDDAIVVMSDYAREDRGNKRVPEFINIIKNMKKMSLIIADKESMLRNGKIDMQSALELADLYQQSGQQGKLANFIGTLMSNSNIPFQVALRLADTSMRAGIIPIMNQCLDYCMQIMPTNAPPETYIQLAQRYAETRQGRQMRDMLTIYLEKRPEDWRAWMDKAMLDREMGKTNESMQSMDNAIRYGGREAFEVARSNTYLAPLLRAPAQQKKNIRNLGLIR